MVPDSDAHRAGLQEGDQVLSVNDVDFQDIEHSKVTDNGNNVTLAAVYLFIICCKCTYNINSAVVQVRAIFCNTKTIYG